MAWNEIEELVRQAQQGDRQAYGRLVERLQGMVFAVALTRLRDVMEAQELAQEVFIHAMTRLDQLRDPACFVGWLKQITVRMAINRATRRGPLLGTEPELLANTPAQAENPLDAMLRAEEKAALHVGLNRLKPLDKATLVAFYLRGRSLKQMSREFETPVGTIKRRLHVARKRLKKQLERGVKKTRRRREELVGV